jgi:hypothetical protein
MLGQIDGLLDVGELRFIWKAGFQKNSPCGCGRNFGDCDFWSAVTSKALGTVDEQQAKRFRSMQHLAERPFRKSKIVGAFIRNHRWWKNLREYAGIIQRIIDAACEVSGRHTVVDSSKLPAHGVALSTADNIDLHVIHLVRDPRAMAFSWRRRKPTTGPDGRRTFMRRLGYAKSSRYWNRENHDAASLKNAASSYTLVRYEDFVNAPEEQMRHILRAVGQNDFDLSFLNGHEVHLAHTHSISGNPMRFENGAVTISPDLAWCENMNPWGKWLVSCLTRRLRRLYGY